jgi:uncharacterized protein (UPF0335 family)
MGAQKPQNKIKTAERRRLIVELRQQGLEWKTIVQRVKEQFPADQLPKGFDERYAYKDLVRALKAAEADLQESARTMLQLELDRLNKLQTGLWPKALQGDTDAVKTVLQLMKRRAKYMGLDEPEEIRARMDVGMDEVLPALMEALQDFPEARAAAADALTDD